MNPVSGAVHPKVVSFPGGKPRASEAALQLVTDLKRLAVEALDERMKAMFDGADDLLFEFAERSTNDSDRRLFFDTMRTVRLGRKNLLARFTAAIEAGFVPASSPVASEPVATITEDQMALQNTEALELGIAVSNMIGKAEGLYRQLVWDISSRLQTLSSEQGASIAPNALAPETICTAFRKSAESLEVEFAVELVIFKLFDRFIVGELGDLYGRVLQFLKQSGLKAAQTRVGPAGNRRVDGARPDFAPVSASPWDSLVSGSATSQAELAAALVAAPSLDLATLAALRQLQGTDYSSGSTMLGPGGASSYSNAHLAADLTAAAQGQTILGWGAKQTTAYMQRASLVGHMFNDILTDPYLPAAIRGQFEALRLATIKVALRDLAFVSEPDHPVRGLINELAAMATAARAASGEDSLARIAELVGEIQKQFDVAADLLRKPSAEVELLDTEQAERFLEQQAAQTTARRHAMVKKVRRVIAEELQLRARGTAITDDLKPLLHSAWAPMMAMQLLQHGPESEQWLEGLRLLDRVLLCLHRDHPEARVPEQRQALVADLASVFTEVKLGEDRLRAALDGFGRAIDAAAAEATAAQVAEADEVVEPADTVDTVETREPASQDAEGPAEGETIAPKDDEGAQLLEMLLQPGAWFLVHDHDRGEPRWMKAVAFYAGLDCGAFAEFNGGNTLIVKAKPLLDDLVARRTVPVDLSPSVKDSFERYVARAQA